MIPQKRRLLVWEARHDNGWTSVVAEQPDGTFVAWAGRADTIGVDYVEDTPEHAQAGALYALNRKSGHAKCSSRCSDWEMRTHEILVASPGGGNGTDDEGGV
jgi:hypothetical protein